MSDIGIFVKRSLTLGGSTVSPDEKSSSQLYALICQFPYLFSWNQPDHFCAARKKIIYRDGSGDVA